ncbi:HD domain-containing protein [bacterium]|nr:HD domain-containing protein [bacterium]
MEFVYRLKSLPRSGWIQSGISETQVESIAGHSFGMSMLILNLRTILHENGINVERALKMALVHDVAEAIVGDLTPLDVVSDHEKHIAEKEAFGQIVGDVPEGSFLSELWDEFEAGQTAEAQIVKRMDKLDMLIQAYFYEKQNFIRLDSFWENMDELFKDTESQSIYDYIRLNRYTF